MTLRHESDMPVSMKDLGAGVRMMREGAPEIWEAWSKFVQLGLEPSVLDRKTKEFVALGMSLSSGCAYCIEVHVQKALDAGATPQELIAVCHVAMVMGGSPAMTYVAEVHKALEVYAEKQKAAAAAGSEG